MRHWMLLTLAGKATAKAREVGKVDKSGRQKRWANTA